ncbi:Type I fimbrial protein FimA [Pseudomonas sp. JV551A1]|uniref:Type I fimbrial protein FimA n=1 Tax=Pseudomonas inefficax TaxID=2078786 RepID=A0AAQ1STI5_9PSED|nr:MULTISPECIES: fimbrial protein [Pseudomonas]SPO54040.1 Type I fimbrial protein FimA [Pseudomonas sp. JV551A1]SPO60294.1 Type I fimbrial protein FimA [Pseudomonas inefficax]
MKRILALFALGLGCSSAMANTGIINFEGSVKAGGTCPISVVTPGGPGLPKLYLGDFKAEDFTAAGMKTPLQRFALRLDPATCPSPPADTTVTFNAGFGADPTGKLYALQSGVGYSEGFALAIYDKSNAQLDPGAASVTYVLDPTKPTDMNFTAQLHTTAAKVTEGHIATSVDFAVEIP